MENQSPTMPKARATSSRSRDQQLSPSDSIIGSDESSGEADHYKPPAKRHIQKLWSLAVQQADTAMELKRRGTGAPMDRKRRNAESASLGRLRHSMYTSLLEQAVESLHASLEEAQRDVIRERVKNTESRRLCGTLRASLMKARRPAKLVAPAPLLLPLSPPQQHQEDIGRDVELAELLAQSDTMSMPPNSPPDSSPFITDEMLSAWFV